MGTRLSSTEEREQALLAPYAMHSAQSAGREHPEPDHPYRGPFQRDRDRITHSAAYRRLSCKTQVFTGELGDYHRTRLTHTLEVASVARTIGRALALNEDLIEALALVHDLGHPPFGHAGEDLLDECLRDEGGFSHNAQALRIVRELETRYHDFPGLNLTREVLEGQATRIAHDTGQQRPLLETQVVEAADSITYDTHDADDALEFGLLALDELLTIDLWAEAAQRVRQRGAALEGGELRRAVLHELIDWQVSDLLDRASQRLAEGRFDSAQAVRQAELIIVASEDLAARKKDLEGFLRSRVYQHPSVLMHRREAQAALRAMFEAFVAQSELLPESFRRRSSVVGIRRSVGDYLAGMTDRFAWREYKRLFGNGVPGLETPKADI
ncbi:MAG: dNTP triphosphohydrolase [Planctomycetia bacterium]|nr:dNTP triphosphohydrolase [Planctomycetia bacterium]